LKGGILLGIDVAQIPHREPEAQRRVMSQLFTWLTERKLEPVVGKVFAFEDFRDAFTTMQSRSALGKMVVRISQQASGGPKDAGHLKRRGGFREQGQKEK
jgi:NADPH2:quinone reductase